ncbi:hypothetical protein M407DRAFT_128690 [Tulasnella calospora MUT 4182]|uniref:Protein kinase domain-containing protein n=1 Tax=Tulasnella calospora MUT 4182 TaxID=1051891 RepID=A0A0C3QRY6_9AGAM|nr:hypothetical protein M407DRAFT_128690 [Tulasnella calospora MUT 4182]
MPFIGYQMEGRLEVRLVSPWEENGNLWSYIRDNEVDEIQRLRFLQQSARGLAYLHGLTPPIAHGDMKTDNIIVRSDLTAALSDFGISRIILDLDNPTGLTTATMGPAGTLRFQAPEILSGGLPSPSSDIYAMAGVILHVMSGEKPYGAMRNKHAIMLEILKGVVPKPQDHARLPEADPLWPFLRRCWDQTTGMRPVALDVVDEVGNGIDRRTIPDHAQMPE